jgi:hypothetical protein
MIRSTLKKLRQTVLEWLPLRFRFALRYMKCHKRFSLLLRPTLFTEKNMLRIAIDRREILRVCADKVRMRELVAATIGEEYLPKLLGTFSDPSEIPWHHLPARFVLKASHGSGMVEIVDNFDPDCVVCLNKLHETLMTWLSIDYGAKSREWAYVNIPRKILVEEFIVSDRSGTNGVPWDFKCFVFGGECAMIQVDTGKGLDRRMDFFSRSWHPLNTSYIDLYPNSDDAIAAPPCLNELINVAEKIGRDFDFVRVDLYSTATGPPLVGELTMTPGGGIEVKFTNPDVDVMLGRKWSFQKE